MADETMTLLPCPFCGETGVTVVEGSTFRWMFAACDHCGASCGEVRVQTHGDGTPEQWREQGKRDAIDEWNRRAPVIAARKVPDGWQLVPIEPTVEMLNGARDWSVRKNGMGVGHDQATGCYAAMLAAAPKVTP